MKFTKTTAWEPTGFKIEVTKGNRGYKEFDRVGVFENLNPQVRFVHCTSRWNMFRLGLWLVARAIFAEIKEST